MDGIVGVANGDGLIDSCHNIGNINGADMIGGISGSIIGDVLVDRCYNIGSVKGENQIGGISGTLFNGSQIQLQNCYNTGNMDGNSAVGGIVGTNQGEFINCYNTGDVNAVYTAGGIVGNNQGKCSNSYNIGNVSGTRAGGVAGQNDSTNAILKNSYSLEGKCENVSGGNINGGTMELSSIKTEQEMKSLASTLGSAFKDDYEEESINDGYPILSWQ